MAPQLLPIASRLSSTKFTMLGRCCLLLLWICVQGYLTVKLPRGSSPIALKCLEDSNCYQDDAVTPNPQSSLVAIGVSDLLFPGEELEWWCDGVLLGRQVVLTSASCILSFTSNATKPYIIARLGRGTHSQQIPVSHLNLHPDYFHSPQHHDVGLLRLKRPANLTGDVVAACIFSAESTSNVLSAVVSARDHPSPHGKLKREDPQWRSVDTVGCGVASHTNLLCVRSPNLLMKVPGPLLKKSSCRVEVLGIPSFDFQPLDAGGLLAYTRVAVFARWLETQMSHFLALD